MNALLPFEPIPAQPRGPEIIIDSFAGGGGTSTGIEAALARSPDVAINHDHKAVALHAANHPDTAHYCQSVMAVDPREVAGGRPVGLAWFSPDCKHFSKAKGGKPLSRNIRDMAWVVVHYAELVRPRVIILENVEEFRTWGPLDSEGRPIKERAGETFDTWVRKLRRLGYRVEWRELRACDYGAPTIRRRLFVIARRDRRPIIWPEPTHGAPDSPEVQAGERIPWRTAAEIIDWSVPCPSIFERKRPLKDATCRRIARGIVRYVIEAEQPFIIPVTHAGDLRAWPTSEPLRTVTSAKRGEFALVSPTLVGTAHGDSGGRREYPVSEPALTVQAQAGNLALVSAHLQHMHGRSVGRRSDIPAPTVATREKIALCSAFLAKHYGGVVGHGVQQPAGTVTTVDHHGLVAAHMLNLRGSERGGRSCEEPAATVTANGTHAGLVAAFLQKYYGTGGQHQTPADPLHTVPSKARFGLVTVEIAGEPYAIVDIGMRMLTPRELFRAQGFPEDYVIDLEVGGRRLTKADQIRMCGNSVCPPLAEALVGANVPELAVNAHTQAEAIG